ncbi:hypothetical protein B9Z55_003086 [Caenorhabditis nigoni]|uniref:Secreted protein n=1 Tax=Caenorhabditis nigoni TaxID=1611254 RepID=A0A2G5VNY7_9PELO|nr:hypothetical protein B9Z55_003086 [Caenorhabditis nigoni]
MLMRSLIPSASLLILMETRCSFVATVSLDYLKKQLIMKTKREPRERGDKTEEYQKNVQSITTSVKKREKMERFALTTHCFQNEIDTKLPKRTKETKENGKICLENYIWLRIRENWLKY